MCTVFVRPPKKRIAAHLQAEKQLLKYIRHAVPHKIYLLFLAPTGREGPVCGCQESLQAGVP